MGAFTPYQIGVTLWAFVALLALPAICGLIVHSAGGSVTIHRRAKRAFVVCFVCFALYALINMSMIHDRIQAPSSGFGALPAILMSAVGYGIVAAAVAGFIASLPVHHTEQGY
jgi:hypothetical protein